MSVNKCQKESNKVHVAWSLFGIGEQQPPNAHPRRAVVLTIIFAEIQQLGACFHKLQLLLRCWPGDLFSRLTHIILGRAGHLHGFMSYMTHTAVGICLLHLLFCRGFGCWCLAGAGDVQHTRGRSKVHILVPLLAQFSLICCYGNQLYESKFAPKGQTQFLWHLASTLKHLNIVISVEKCMWGRALLDDLEPS